MARDDSSFCAVMASQSYIQFKFSSVMSDLLRDTEFRGLWCGWPTTWQENIYSSCLG